MKRKHKVGESIPDIAREQAVTLHNNVSPDCNNYLVRRPGARINHISIFKYRWYSESSWQCLRCKWESETMKKRTI